MELLIRIAMNVLFLVGATSGVALMKSLEQSADMVFENNKPTRRVIRQHLLLLALSVTSLVLSFILTFKQTY